MIIDTRVYKGFVSNACLIGASAFMNKNGETTEEARLNKLHRLKYFSKDNRFKAANTATVLDQFHKSKLALHETRNFEVLLGTTEWPECLLVMKN